MSGSSTTGSDALRGALQRGDHLKRLILDCVSILTCDPEVPRDIVERVRDLLGVAGISLGHCTKRTVYRVKARSFSLAVHAGNGTFIGIRDKFESRFLFEEYHQDLGLPFGTVVPLEVVATTPTGIELDVRSTALFNYLESIAHLAEE